MAQEINIMPIGKDLNFAAAEAYRLLRTNLQFSLPDEQRCRIIGVTSANAGEGKSTTSINLSYMLAEAGKKVILIEADMRLPTISKRLKVQMKPGLSNLLAGLCDTSDVIRLTELQDGLYMVPCGDVPPNPSELLGSRQMGEVVQDLASLVDYIIFDLPPLNEVSDALVVSQYTDGIVMVVRQNYATRRAVTEAMNQLKSANVKVLGFVLTCSDAIKKKYNGKYKYYKKGYGAKYGRRGYGYGYGSHYARSYAESYAESYAAAAEEAAGRTEESKRD